MIQKRTKIRDRNALATIMGQILNLVIPGTKIDEDNMLKVEIVRLSPVGIGVEFKGMLKKKTRK